MPARQPSDSDTSHSSSSLSSSSKSSRSRSHSPSPARDESHEPTLGTHVNSTLILVHDEEDEDQENDASSFSFSDEEDQDGLLASSSPALSSTPTPLLSPSSAFVHFLAPCLKLGAVATLTSHLPLKFAIPALLIFSALAAFARQVWFLLARYVRKADLAEIAIEAFAKRKGQEKSKRAIRESSRWGTIATRWLLTVVYLRGSFLHAHKAIFCLIMTDLPCSLCVNHHADTSTHHTTRSITCVYHRRLHPLCSAIHHCEVSCEQTDHLYRLVVRGDLHCMARCSDLRAQCWLSRFRRLPRTVRGVDQRYS